MNNLISQVPVPQNETVLNYAPDSTETRELKKQLTILSAIETEIPIVINGRSIKTEKIESITAPHRHALKLGHYHKAGPNEVKAAINGALNVAKEWAAMPYSSRAAIFLKAADLLATKYRPTINAATMLGQSKTCYQAEIDSACELIDFLRFNVHFQEQMYSMQPKSGPGMWNRMEYRPLEGFVFAVTPFNFTAIAGNLPTSAALLGNVVVWKPASTAVYSGHFLMKLFEEAGLPPGVIQFLPGSGATVGDICIKDKNLAGVHFTGSTGVFQNMWKTIGDNIHSYRSYPRIVGETGGKDFIFAHPSADIDGLVTAMVRGAFEYQGQKCSAASRAYIPKSIWKEVKEKLVAEVKSISLGDVSDFKNFMGAVIDKKSFENIRGYIDGVKKSDEAEIIVGGKCQDEVGYFIEPTIIETKNPGYRTMCEEIFGPVITIFAYDDNRYEETLRLCDETSPYALTGCIWSQDRKAIDLALTVLTQSAGNFYINNKPTGAVVGQQPFGGARGSGTNDKAGSLLNLFRWVSARTVSETFAPPKNYRYPFMT